MAQNLLKCEYSVGSFFGVTDIILLVFTIFEDQ